MSREFDHLVLCVRDLDEARKAYAAMGFTLAPKARHPFGTANSNIQLQECFLELLTVAAPEDIPEHRTRHFSFAAFNRSYLESGMGMSMLVFRSDDARADAEVFRKARLADYAPFDFSRKARLPGGEEVTVGFSLAFVTHPDMPRAAFFTCQQHAPEHFWKPQYQTHANTARDIAHVVMLADRPGAYADFFRKLMGARNVASSGNVVTVECGGGTLSMLTPEAFGHRFGGETPTAAPQARFAAFSVAVDDLHAARGAMREGGIVHREHDGRLVVDPTAAFGVLIEFEQASA